MMISRPSRAHMYMEMAEAAAKRSTCFRRAVGAILVLHNNVISIGYNGPPSGEDHCTGKNCPTAMGCTRAVHAEVNVFKRCPEFFIMYDYAKMDLYVTESPCPDCAKLIISKKIRALYFMHEYRIQIEVDKLNRNHVQVFRLTPSGYTIDCSNGELVNVD